MTRDELYTFVTSLLSGFQMDTTLFNTYLNIAQRRIERSRPWVILRGIDHSQTVNGNMFDVGVDMPEDFNRWYGRTPVVVPGASASPTVFLEIPISYKYQYQQTSYRFFVDYTSNPKKLYMTNSAPTGGTIYMYYMKASTLVSSSADATWVFPTDFHPILGLYVATYWKLGVDFDLVNNSQANAQTQEAADLWNEMKRWDSDLQNGMTFGVDFGDGRFPHRTPDGGIIPYFG